MRYEKEQAIKLRLKGKSYTEIKNILDTSKSTLSGWLKGIQLSQHLQEQINIKTRQASITALIKRNKLQTHLAQQKAKQTQEAACKELGVINDRELFLLGVSLYWAEGHKRPIIFQGKQKTYHSVKLSNSDPALIALFLKFLRNVCKVPENKISAGLRIYQHHNAEELLQFWHKTTKIPVSQFQKLYYGVSKSSLGKRPFNILPYGTLQIVVNDTKLYHTIMGWIKGLQKNSL